MSSIAGAICFYGCFYGCLFCCDACILLSWLQNNRNCLKSLLRLLLWLIINYYIFRFFGWNEYIFNILEIAGISDEVLKLEDSLSNFFIIRYITKIYDIFAYIGYSRSTYNLSLLVPILLWINPLQSIDKKVSTVLFLLNWNILYIYSATLDENSQYGKIFPSVYPVLHVIASYLIYWKRSPLINSSSKSSLNTALGMNHFLLFTFWVILFSKIYYGSLSTGILEIMKWLFGIFTEYIILYIIVMIYALLFSLFADYIHGNSYARRPKGKNLQQIENFALSELLGFFGLLILTVFLYWTYVILDYLLASPWLLTEGFVLMLAYVATLCMSFSGPSGSFNSSDIGTKNFVAFYMQFIVIRLLLT